MIFQNCVICGDKVDVDNCFGSIAESETFCKAHEDERILMDDLDEILKDANQNVRVIEDRIRRTRRNICKYESEQVNGK